MSVAILAQGFGLEHVYHPAIQGSPPSPPYLVVVLSLCSPAMAVAGGKGGAPMQPWFQKPWGCGHCGKRDNLGRHFWCASCHSPRPAPPPPLGHDVSSWPAPGAGGRKRPKTQRLRNRNREERPPATSEAQAATLEGGALVQAPPPGEPSKPDT